MTPSPFAVLYVDDDPRNVHAFRLAFKDHFRILSASSGEEALAVMGREPVGVLLTDQRMPGMTGAQLCAESKQRFPNVVRIIVTAYSDIHAVLEAINSGEVSRYVVKPWREDAMLEVIRAGLEAFQLTNLYQDLQMRLLQQEQQAASTLILGRVLHEIVSPAVGIRDNIGFLKDTVGQLASMAAARAPELPQLANSLLPALDDAYESAEELVARIERFRQGEAPLAAVRAGASLERAVHAAASIVRTRMRERARLVLQLVEKPLVRADPLQLSQIAVNLLVNAFEAIEPGMPERNQVTVATFLRNDRCGLIVEDTGSGVPPELRERLFDPFVSSKESAQGRGLGLAIVRDIVEGLAGSIQVDHPARGTRFTVELPRAG